MLSVFQGGEKANGLSAAELGGRSKRSFSSSLHLLKWVWLKIQPPGAQVSVHVSISQGSMLGTFFFLHGIPSWLVNSPVILGPILAVGLGCSLGGFRDFDPWPNESSRLFAPVGFKRNPALHIFLCIARKAYGHYRIRI